MSAKVLVFERNHVPQVHLGFRHSLLANAKHGEVVLQVRVVGLNALGETSLAQES